MEYLLSDVVSGDRVGQKGDFVLKVTKVFGNLDNIKQMIEKKETPRQLVIIIDVIDSNNWAAKVKFFFGLLDDPKKKWKELYDYGLEIFKDQTTGEDIVGTWFKFVNATIQKENYTGRLALTFNPKENDDFHMMGTNPLLCIHFL